MKIWLRREWWIVTGLSVLTAITAWGLAAPPPAQPAKARGQYAALGRQLNGAGSVAFAFKTPEDWYDDANPARDETKGGYDLVFEKLVGRKVNKGVHVELVDLLNAIADKGWELAFWTECRLPTFSRGNEAAGRMDVVWG